MLQHPSHCTPTSPELFLSLGVLKGSWSEASFLLIWVTNVCWWTKMTTEEETGKQEFFYSQPMIVCVLQTDIMCSICLVAAWDSSRKTSKKFLCIQNNLINLKEMNKKIIFHWFGLFLIKIHLNKQHYKLDRNELLIKHWNLFLLNLYSTLQTSLHCHDSSSQHRETLYFFKVFRWPQNGLFLMYKQQCRWTHNSNGKKKTQKNNNNK